MTKQNHAFLRTARRNMKATYQTTVQPVLIKLFEQSQSEQSLSKDPFKYMFQEGGTQKTEKTLK